MAGIDASPAAASRKSNASNASPKENTSAPAQPTTPNSTRSAVAPSRSSESFDHLTALQASQSASPSLAIRTKGRKRTSSGSVKELAWGPPTSSQSEASVESVDLGIQRPMSKEKEGWPRIVGSRSLSILTSEKPLATSRSPSSLSSRAASTNIEEKKKRTSAKHERQRSQLEWRNGSKFEDLPQLR
ncbi:hypothetical protein PMZ80_003306 [Knufia obscura]|uniref:Uncharacterized protein n=2 Tax=Knufia TaxID=430999 RepID=A0AAN8EAA1_9EURO|nr:hypothetical protein PMZ80_003306 [Knufia obscura]KAK5950424.1 hypothetical protein OHC33_008643 [Knufia fluminis]